MSWITKPIGAFCHTGSGGTPSRQQESRFYGGSIPWVKSGELKESIVFETEETITEAALAESSAKIIPPGALLVAMYGATVGRIAILGIEAASNQAVCHIVPDESAADQRYLFYALRTQVPRWLEQRVGGAQPNINQQIIRDTQIPLPPLEEQRRIAAILDKADAVRRKRQSAIALTEELLRSAFLEMFGDPVTNPKGWEMQPLASLCTIRRGGSPRPIEAYLGGSVPWIKIGDATDTDDIHIRRTAESIKPEGVKKSLYLEPGSLILANSGVSLGFARILEIGGCIHDGWLAFSDINESLNKIYLLKLLNSVTNHFRQIAPSGTQPNLNTSIMKEFKVPVPPIQLQAKFANFTERFISSKQRYTDAAKESDHFFNSLLQRAFRGEL